MTELPEQTSEQAASAHAEDNGVAGESWNLASEYPAADAPELDADLGKLHSLLDDIERRNASLTPHIGSAEAPADAIAEARTIHTLTDDAGCLLRDPNTYAQCCLSVDSQDEAAQALLGRLQGAAKRFAAATAPLAQFLDLAPDAVVEAFLDDPATAPARFAVLHARKRSSERLPLEQETLVSSLSQDGIEAWSRLYDQLAGTLTCAVEENGETHHMGLAQTCGLLLDADDSRRERGWRAINGAWEQHAESCAAAINAISGWRLEMCRQRGRNGSAVHYLDAPAHANRITRDTLEALLGVAEESVPLARRAALLQAKAYGKERYGPWDTRAPAPASADAAGVIGYREALNLIRDAYASVDPSMGEFVDMMDRKRWIEGTVGPRKRPGAYCTSFRKSRTPRVYMTYNGGASDVITLAHELGHAFHAWVMRDLPDSQSRYGMSLAETASTFGETVVRDALLQRAESSGDSAQMLDIVWEEVGALVSFVLNIPTRFEFERRFYDARAERPQRPEELKEMMRDAWRKWYGESLSEPDAMFWASKLHFYISGISFYNFPYLFGYLFSQGIYARRASFGAEFFPRYEALLCDTGRMTAEELAAKHLDANLSQRDFWRDSVARLAERVDVFDRLVAERAG